MKIAFLFLILTDVYHQSSWRTFFEGAEHNNLYSIYVHSKDSVPRNSFFKKYEIEAKVPTTWECTLLAQTELLKEALKDPKNERFVYLSESTIPLQSFHTAYKRLMGDSRSQFFYTANPNKERVFPPIPPTLVYKNSQWVILNRKHAELMVNNNLILSSIANKSHDQEHFHGTYLVNHGLAKEINKRDHTLVLWPEPLPRSNPHTFTNVKQDPHTPELMKAIVHKEYLFARKFDKNCDLTPLKMLV